MKVCTSCNETKEYSEFTKQMKGKDGYRSYCKKCSKILSKEYREKNKERLNEWCRNYAKNKRKKNPDAEKNYILKSKYGITLDEYHELVKEQNQQCAICNIEPSNRLYVDHCHRTGKIRGLLCMKCNAGIGLLQDNPEILLIAYNYLKK